MAARWIPHLLTETQKQQSVACSMQLLEMFGLDSPERICDIVTGETWISFCGTPNKGPNRVWIISFCRTPNKRSLWVWMNSFYGTPNERSTWVWMISFYGTPNKRSTWVWMISFYDTPNKRPSRVWMFHSMALKTNDPVGCGCFILWHSKQAIHLGVDDFIL